VPALLRLGVIDERAGNLHDAAAHYRRALALWADADADLRTSIEWARARLDALEMPAAATTGERRR
jgi:hypothetical protein